MAHWDHLGKHEGETGDNIYNGAVDNATGVAGIIEIAERPYGSLTYAVTGTDAAVDAALAELAGSGGYTEHDRATLPNSEGHR